MFTWKTVLFKLMGLLLLTQIMHNLCSNDYYFLPMNYHDDNCEAIIICYKDKMQLKNGW